jgi:hypothetical protein
LTCWALARAELDKSEKNDGRDDRMNQVQLQSEW